MSMQAGNRSILAFMLCAIVILLSGLQHASAQVNDPPPVPVVPSDEYKSFLYKYASAERIEPFYFFKNYMDFKGRNIMFDARFLKRIAADQIYVKIWRNFGTMMLTLTDVPANAVIPEVQPLLLVGVMTDYKNVVIDGKLESMAIVKFTDDYVCKDPRCNQ